MEKTETRILARTLVRELSDAEQKLVFGGCTQTQTCCAPDFELDDGCETSASIGGS